MILPVSIDPHLAGPQKALAFIPSYGQPWTWVSTASIESCLDDLKSCMSSNFLWLNDDKTEIHVIGSQLITEEVLPSAGASFNNVKPATKSLGGVW